MHIVQKVSSAMFRSGNMNYSKVYGAGIRIFTLQEWGITDSAAYITYVVLLISFTFNIFIFCYIGELVAEQVYSSLSEASKRLNISLRQRIRN